MRIGELAERTGVSVRALRYYEEKGLLRPRRTGNGYREFAEADVRTVAHTQTLIAAGLGTSLIKDILGCLTSGTPLLHGCHDRVARERARMTLELDRIRTARDLLDELLAEDTRPAV